MVYTLINNKELVEEMGNILVGGASCRLPAQQGWHAEEVGHASSIIISTYAMRRLGRVHVTAQAGRNSNMNNLN